MHSSVEGGIPITSCHVGGLFSTSAKAGEAEIMKILRELPTGSIEQGSFVYCGLKREQGPHALVTRGNGEHRAEGPEEVSIKEGNRFCGAKECRSARGKITYAVQNLRPGYSSDPKEVVCGGHEKRTHEGVDKTNQLTREVKADVGRGLAHPRIIKGETPQEKPKRLEQGTILILVGASPKGQMGFLTPVLGQNFQAGGERHGCGLLGWQLTKIPKDGSGSYRPEMRGFYTAHACGGGLQTDIQRLTGVKVPITVGTGSQPLLARLRPGNAIKGGGSEACSELEVLLTSFWAKEFSIVLISDEANAADLMAKPKNSSKTQKTAKPQEIMGGEFKLGSQDLERGKIGKGQFIDKCTGAKEQEKEIRGWRAGFTELYGERVLGSRKLHDMLVNSDVDMYGAASQDTWGICRNLYIRLGHTQNKKEEEEEKQYEPNNTKKSAPDTKFQDHSVASKYSAAKNRTNSGKEEWGITHQRRSNRRHRT